MVVREAQAAGNLVAQLDQLLEVRLHDLADALARLPDLLAFGRVLRLLQDLADLAVRELFPCHLGAVDVEGLLDRVRLRRDLPQQSGIDLLLQIQQVKHLDLAGEQRVADRALLDLLELVEPVMVGEYGIKLVLGPLLGGEIAILSCHVGHPPGEIGSLLERSDFGFVTCDECLGQVIGVEARHGSLLGPCDGSQGSGTNQMSSPREKLATRR